MTYAISGTALVANGCHPGVTEWSIAGWEKAGRLGRMKSEKKAEDKGSGLRPRVELPLPPGDSPRLGPDEETLVCCPACRRGMVSSGIAVKVKKALEEK